MQIIILPSSVQYNGVYYYYLRNAQGDVIGIVNASGARVVTYTYDAWGNPLSTTGSMASTLGALNPLRYRGYVYDTETGLYYLQSRYYDPEICRFINADGYASTGQGLLGGNAFVYCENNPVLNIDPYGLFNWGGVLTGLAFIGGAIAIVATLGTATPAVVCLAGILGTTGAVMTYTAAIDSAMVIDISASAPTNNIGLLSTYEKVGVSLLIDYSDDGGVYGYCHSGFGISAGQCGGTSYSVGIVDNFKQPDNYAGGFFDYYVSGTAGFDRCFSSSTVSGSPKIYATSVTFSTSKGNSMGIGYDHYSSPLTISKRNKTTSKTTTVARNKSRAKTVLM